MNNKFQNLTVDFSQLRSIPIQERVALAGSPLGNSIFGNMSPTEIARLFPKYYQDTIPAIGGLSGAVSGGTNMGGGSSGVAPAEPVPLSLAQRLAQAAAAKRFNNGQPGKDGRVAGIGNLEGRQKTQKRVYDGFIAAGFSHKQSIALTAEVGRENGYNQRIMFGTHSDPYNNATNLGMLSMQGSRLTALKKHLQTEGRIAEDGAIIQDQETINSMARFYKTEMLTSENSPRVQEFLANPDIDREKAAELLGKGYIRWRYDDPRYGHHKEYTKQYYLEAEDAVANFDKISPTPNTHLQEGTDAGTTPLTTDGENGTTRPESKPRITPETIGSVEGLSPAVIEYAGTLSGADAAQFYENLNTVGNIDEINRMSQESPSAVGQTSPQQPVSSTNVIPENSLTERYDNLRQNYSETIERGSPIWNEIDPVFGQNLDHDRNNRQMSTGILDWDTDKVSRETLIAADAAAKVLRKYGYAPRIANGGGGNDHSGNHGKGRDKNYAIDMAAFDQEGRAITLAQLPKEIKQEMYQAARLTAANDTGMALGYSMNNTSAHLQAGDDTREMSFWGYSNGQGNESSASLQNTQEGQEFLNQMQQISQMTPEQRANHLDTLTNTQRYDQVNPTPNEHVQTNDLGAVETDAAPVPVPNDNNTEVTTPPPEPVPVPETTPEQPTAVPEQAAEVPAQQMAQGGYIDQKDNLQVVDKTSGDVKAEINNGELQDGIDAKGGGLQVKSNVTRKADDLIQKYDDQTNVDSPTDPAAKKARPEERDPVQGGMSSPIQNSQAASHIGNIPGTNAFNEIHASLHRAYGLSRDRMNYGNVS